MGARRQITFFDEPIGGGDWSPTGARKGIAYIRDVGGNENYQLEYLDPASADPVRLTDGRGRADTGVWSPDGTKYAFQWTARNGVATDVYVDDPLDRRAPELVFEAPEVGWNVGRLVAGRQVAAAHPLRLGQRDATSGSTTSRRARSGRSSPRR